MSKNISAYGINYTLPEAHLMHATPLFISEFGARTCYNSFDKSENKSIDTLNTTLNSDGDIDLMKHNCITSATNEVNTNGSELLHDLSHVYHHASVLEHTTLNFLIKNTSRAVLQELARTRIASFSVQSTRYTLSDVVNWFIVTKLLGKDVDFYVEKIDALDLLVTDDRGYNAIEITGMFNKLNYQWNMLGEEEFLKLSVAKSNLEIVTNYGEQDKVDDPVSDLFSILSSKAKKNVGDFVKNCVPETMSVSLMFSINLRSLKNFIDLRLSGAAFWQIQLLSHAIYKQIPENYLELIVKDAKRNQFDTVDKRIESGVWA